MYSGHNLNQNAFNQWYQLKKRISLVDYDKKNIVIG